MPIIILWISNLNFEISNWNLKFSNLILNLCVNWWCMCENVLTVSARCMVSILYRCLCSRFEIYLKFVCNVFCKRNDCQMTMKLQITEGIILLHNKCGRWDNNQNLNWFDKIWIIWLRTLYNTHEKLATNSSPHSKQKNKNNFDLRMRRVRKMLKSNWNVANRIILENRDLQILSDPIILKIEISKKWFQFWTLKIDGTCLRTFCPQM